MKTTIKRSEVMKATTAISGDKTMTKKTKTPAEQVYERRTESVELLLSDIRSMVARHCIGGGHINWCHVGDMAHIEFKLSEIKQFLQGGVR